MSFYYLHFQNINDKHHLTPNILITISRSVSEDIKNVMVINMFWYPDTKLKPCGELWSTSVERLRLTSTSSDSHWDTQIYNSVLASYLIRNIVLNIWGIFSPHEKMMVINLPPRSGYQGPFPVLGTPQNYTWWFNWRIPNYGLIIDWSPSQWTELQEFPVWIRFLSSQQKCTNC